MEQVHLSWLDLRWRLLTTGTDNVDSLVDIEFSCNGSVNFWVQGVLLLAISFTGGSSADWRGGRPLRGPHPLWRLEGLLRQCSHLNILVKSALRHPGRTHLLIPLFTG